MTAHAAIQTVWLGHRTVIEFLLSPLRAGMQVAARE